VLRQLQLFHQLQRNQSYTLQGFGSAESIEHGFIWHLLLISKMSVEELLAEVCSVSPVHGVSASSHEAAIRECVHGIGHAVFHRVAHLYHPNYSACTPFQANGGSSDVILERRLRSECMDLPQKAQRGCLDGAFHSLAAYSNLSRYRMHWSRLLAFQMCSTSTRDWANDLWRPLPPPLPPFAPWSQKMETASQASSAIQFGATWLYVGLIIAALFRSWRISARML